MMRQVEDGAQVSGASRHLAGGRQVGGTFVKWFALLFAVLFAVGLFAPIETDPRLGDEIWWPVMLHEAFAKGRQWGSDVLFTWGPWGIISGGYHPATLLLATLLRAGLALIAMLALWDLVERRTGSATIAALASLLLPLAGAICWPDLLTVFWPYLLLFYLFELPERRSSLVGVTLVVASALLALAKFTLFVSIGVILALIAIDDLSRRRKPLSLTLISASSLALWLAARQSIAGIATWIERTLELTRGYNDAMGLDAPLYQPWAIAPFLASTLLFVIGAALAGRARRLHRPWLYVVALCGLLFLTFKHGFVRADHFHIAPACATLFLAQVFHLIVARTRKQARPIPTALALFLAVPLLCAAWLVHEFQGASLVTETRNAIAQSERGVRLLIDWKRYAAGLAENERLAMAGLQPDGRLVIPPGTADQFPAPSDLVMDHLGVRYSPRLVFRSHEVWTRPIARLNASRFEHSPPDTVVFDVRPIDHRYPSIEDGASWPWLLACYGLRQRTDGPLVLEHLVGREAPRFDSAGSIEGRIGTAVPIPLHDDQLLFARVNVSLSSLGRFVSVLYKPAELQVEVLLSDGSTKRHRLPMGMAASEFLLSPYVATSADFAALFQGGDGPGGAPRMVRAVTILVRGREDDYEPRFSIDMLTLNRPTRPLRSASMHRIRPPKTDTLLIGAGVACTTSLIRWQPDGQ